MKKNNGFTLIELVIVIVIIGIFAAFAIPSYQRYLERRDLAIAKQEALRLANELERFKAKNFSYKGFDAAYAFSDYDKTTGILYLPVGSTSSNAKYILTLVDSDEKTPLTITKNNDGKESADSLKIRGLSWSMKVERQVDRAGLPIQARNYDLLLNSDGLRCMTKTPNVVKNFIDCGGSDNVENW